MSHSQAFGVSWDNDGVFEHPGGPRQDLLRLCHGSNSLLLVQEPDNPEDANAVKLITEFGQIGFVPARPRDAEGVVDPSSVTNKMCTRACSPGRIDWAAAKRGVSNPIIGAQITAALDLRAAYCQLLPRELVAASDPHALLPAEVYRVIERQVLKAASGQCQITGLTHMSLQDRCCTTAQCRCCAACSLHQFLVHVQKQFVHWCAGRGIATFKQWSCLSGACKSAVRRWY